MWELVDRRGPDECWPWQGTKTPKGHGLVCVNSVVMLAHRWAYKYEHGGLSAPVEISHTCGNPLCCNPAHLREGDSNA